ncbi:hypothetical protein EVAR_42513_1 [Eumeta japonica]|uniref:Uncharacterized protein n=1 Tax=Eumeta variegata TaxID=151549 RepID=A0A4C1XJ18_EUMVA|nr:hypothetical protein EVAR_42513_1 [Eumeta japonica]
MLALTISVTRVSRVTRDVVATRIAGFGHRFRSFRVPVERTPRRRRGRRSRGRDRPRHPRGDRVSDDAVFRRACGNAGSSWLFRGVRGEDGPRRRAALRGRRVAGGEGQ